MYAGEPLAVCFTELSSLRWSNQCKQQKIRLIKEVRLCQGLTFCQGDRNLSYGSRSITKGFLRGSDIFYLSLCMHAKSLQQCLILCDPMDNSPTCSPVYGFSRQEYWSGLPCPPPGDLPDPGIKPMSLISSTLAGRFFTISANILFEK